ncbi:MAG: hypothetical protein WA324_18035, partial [Bryobacteraceae bacterium]
LSTGPKTEEGKAKSSHNAVRTGLTGQTVLLPNDDVEAYQKHVARFEAEYKPVADREKELTQNIADTQWRLNRIFSLEQGIYAAGRIEFANLYENEDASARPALIDAKTFTTYQRQINNLSLQNERLRRHYDKDDAEHRSLIAARASRQRSDMQCAATNWVNAQKEGRPFDPKEIGFEFSKDELNAYWTAVDRKNAIGNGKFYTFQKEQAA